MTITSASAPRYPAMSSCIVTDLPEPDLPMSTLCTPILEEEKLTSPHVVKVVFDQKGYALYFSRSLIPYPRKKEDGLVYEHLGLYAYRKDFLMALVRIPQTRLEKIESLEQLRVLESGFHLKVTVTAYPYDGLSVDTQEDLEKVRQIVSQQIEAEQMNRKALE